MKGRVVAERIPSEPVRVEGRYDCCSEEHPGVSNRNQYESRPRGFQNLIFGEYRILFCTLSWSIILTNWVVPRNLTFRPLNRDEGFLFFK